MKVDSDDINEIIEEVHRKDKFDKQFDIGLMSECEYNEGSNNNKEKK